MSAHPDFGSRPLPSLQLLFEVVDLLSQNLPVLQKIIEMAPGLLRANHHLHLIEKPCLMTEKENGSYCETLSPSYLQHKIFDHFSRIMFFYLHSRSCSLHAFVLGIFALLCYLTSLL